MGKKISTLQDAVDLKDSDLILIVETSIDGVPQTTKKTTVSSFRSQLNSSEAIDYYKKYETMTSTEINTLVNNRFIADQSGIPGGVYNRGNWDTAFSWGDHSAQNYERIAQKGAVNGYCDLDAYGQVPVTRLGAAIPSSHVVGGVTQTDLNNWNDAYGWGDHSTAGYFLASEASTVATTGSYADLTGRPSVATSTTTGLMSSTDKSTLDSLVENLDPSGTGGTGLYVKKTDLADVATSGDYADLTNTPTAVSTFTNDLGYLTDYTVTEEDVTAHQAALTITQSQISDLSHFDGTYDSLTGAPTTLSSFTNDSGFITGYTVTEEDVTAHQAALTITQSQISDLSHFDGNYSSLIGAPVLATVATSGSYTDLTNQPTLFDGDYNSLTNIPTSLIKAGAETTTPASTSETFEDAMLLVPVNCITCGLIKTEDAGSGTGFYYQVKYRQVL